MRRAILIILLVALAALGAAGPASAAAEWQLCPGALEEVSCATYTMPLDRSGVLPGTTTVRATRLPAAEGPRMGTMFVIAGGPGQNSGSIVDLMNSGFRGARRYDIIAVDQRGSGSSEPLVCPRIEDLAFRWDGKDPATDRAITDCSTAIGPSRAAYNSYEAVEDIEAIRADLGIESATFFGVSYGSKVALAYAKAHPSHAKALLLDSVLPTDAPESFDLDGLAALRGALAQICAERRCASAGGVPTAGIKRLAERLAKRPLSGGLVTKDGRSIPPLDDAALYSIVFSADANAFVYSQLPGAISSALAGNDAPLQRLYSIVSGAYVTPDARSIGAPSFSLTMFIATTCADLTPPWTRGTDPASRQASIDSAIGAIPDGQLAPFPRATVAAGSAAAFCRGWHQSTTTPPIAQGPLPQIPTLALVGALDLRTPASWATRAVAGNSLAQVVTIPNSGHSVIGTDGSGCALSLARRFLIYGATDGVCRHTSKPLPIAPRAVRSLAAVKPAPGSCAKISRRRCRALRKQLTAAYLAVRDTVDQASLGTGESGPGLYDGYWETDYDITDLLELQPVELKMNGVSNAIGSSVSGSIDLTALPKAIVNLRLGSRRARLSGWLVRDGRGDALTITTGRGADRVKIRIRPRSRSAAKSRAPLRSTLALRRNYLRAVGPLGLRPGL